MDVARIRWPAERARAEALREQGLPRLLVVDDPAVPAPVASDCLEDWVRLPARETDIEARAAALLVRAGGHAPRPCIDGDGLLRHRGAWVPLSPVERALAAALIERTGAVVSRETLAERAWPLGAPTRNALDVHVLRLRRRIAPLGLEIRTVRARGYLLEEPAGRPRATVGVSR